MAFSTNRMASPGHSLGSGTDEFAEADALFQQSDIVVGKEVDDFAKALDQHTVLRGSTAEKRAQIFKLVDHYYDHSCKRVVQLRRQTKTGRRSSARGLFAGAPVRASPQPEGPDDINNRTDKTKGVRTVEEEIKDAEEEAQTWDLLRRLLPLRYRDAHHSSNVRQSIESTSRSRDEIWEDFVMADTTARERRAVLEWLQNTASRGPPIDEIVKDLQRSADRGDILQHSWLHTKGKLKLQKSVNGYQGVLDPSDPALAKSHLSSNTLITQLDPDAMTRQGRKLEPQDDFFERSIWLGCFEMLRRGRSMEEIREWCGERQESWRVASMSALSLSDVQGGDVEGADFAPIYAILWRRMCYAAARDGGHNDYERAVYGLLSGDITSVEKVAKTWDDFLFLNYNALLRTQFDNYLIKQSGPDGLTTAQSFPSFNAVQNHGEPSSVGRRLITTLESSEKTKREAFTPAKAAQGAIVANDLDRFLYNQGAVIARDAQPLEKDDKEREHLCKLIPNPGNHLPEDVYKSTKYIKLKDYDTLRILSHIFVIISSLDDLTGPGDHGTGSKLAARSSFQENILAAYTAHLKKASLTELVPLYSSKLSGDRRYENLVRNLQDVADQVRRENHLGLIKRLGLDINKFVLTGPEVWFGDVEEKEATCDAKGNFKILNGVPATLEDGRQMIVDFFGDDVEHVDPEDENIIRGIEWMLLVPGLFDQTVDYVIRAHTYFLKKMHLTAARALLNRVPLKKIILEKTDYPMPQELDDMSMWMDEFVSQLRNSEMTDGDNQPRHPQRYYVKVLWQIECLVNALDRIETLSSFAQIVREQKAFDLAHHQQYVPNKEMRKSAMAVIRILKMSMEPLLKNWLTEIYEPNVPLHVRDLREAYIPETVLAYISCLQFVGGFGSPDLLMECMDLAVTIADKDSDVTREFMRVGRMRELVEAFACVSKALACSTTAEKGNFTKKNREMGWSKELWSVQA